MKRNAFDEFNDKRIADDSGTYQALMCGAQGCPNCWTVDAGNGRLCSFHAWAEPVEWPAITEQQNRANEDRARARQMPKPPTPKLSKDDKRAILSRLLTLTKPKMGQDKGWAHELQAREEAGERLTLAQRTIWRAALGRGAA